MPTAFAGRSGSIDPLCGGKCCYCRYFSMGRPLRIDGATRIAPLERRATWLSAPPAAARPAPQR